MATKVKSKCWFCKTSVVLVLKTPEKYKGNDTEYYICTSCNAANSTGRVDGEIKSGKSKRVI